MNPILSSLPGLNACLNATTAVSLCLGFLFIKKKNIRVHRIFMTIALGLSALFLTSYLTYHFYAGHTVFLGQGWIRPFYFSMLLSHTVLAVTVLPLALVTSYLALQGRFERHKKLARWTLPIWLYVSVTGVAVYLFLYQMYPDRH